jgi:beta-lactamase class A
MLKHVTCTGILLTLLCLPFIDYAQSADALRQQIERIVSSRNADIGVSILSFEDGDSLSVNGSMYFTMMSVTKFPQALYILSLVDKGKLSASQQLHFDKNDLRKNSFGALKKDYPKRTCDISLKETLRYSAGNSDNDACDKLFAISGGPQATETYIHQLGIKDIKVSSNYADMKQQTLYTNRSTPNAMAGLLKLFYTGSILSDSSKSILWDIMVNTPTTSERLKGLLPKEAVVAHKTGTYYTEARVLEAINDVGIVQLPNGKHYAIAVYVNNSTETPEVTAKTIAEISKAAWDHFAARP